MKNFKDYLKNQLDEDYYPTQGMFVESEDVDQLLEKLITFGGKAYPKFGNVVILAGGAASGKGFVRSHLLGIEGKVFDVDEMKRLALASTGIASKIKKDYGLDIKKFNQKNPDHVMQLHTVISDMGLHKGSQKAFQKSAKEIGTLFSARRPNVIFDVTMKDISKLKKVVTDMTAVGYEKQNMHIIWILNSMEMAIKQNRSRTRVVPEDILISTHEGVALTMKKLFSDSNTLQKYVQGDVWIVANLKGVDSKVVISPKKSTFSGAKPDEAVSYVVDTNIFQVKKKGQKPLTIPEFGDKLLKKIKAYTPHIHGWN